MSRYFHRARPKVGTPVRRHSAWRRLSMTTVVAVVGFGVLQIGATSATPVAASTCIVSTGGLCAVPPPIPVGIGSQTTIGNVGTAGTTTVAACPQLGNPSAATTCGGSSQSASLNCSVAVQTTPQGNTVFGQGQLTCNENVSFHLDYGWDSEDHPVDNTVNAGQEYQVGETFSGGNSGCHTWYVNGGASDNAGNTIGFASDITFCFE